MVGHFSAANVAILISAALTALLPSAQAQPTPQQRKVSQHAPIVIPLRPSKEDSHANYRLTDIANGVTFDIDGDGTPDRMAWTAEESNLAFLAYDRNGNDMVDNGTELFHNHTVPGMLTGFSALAVAMTQADDGRLNAIDAADPLYSKLLLWEDRNHNGVSERTELQSFGDLFASIGTDSGYSPRGPTDQYGNEFKSEGWVETRTGPGLNRAADGGEHSDRLRRVYAVFLRMQ